MPLHSIQYAAFPFGPRNGFGSIEAHEVTSTRDSKAKLNFNSNGQKSWEAGET